MEHKHIAEEIHYSLKELFEICAEVIYKRVNTERMKQVEEF